MKAVCLLGAILSGPALMFAQLPRIGIIDFYGLRTVTQDQVRQALTIKEGDPPQDSPAQLEERVRTIPGVVRVRLNFVCCEAGKMILYVGVEEKDAPQFKLHAAPQGHVALPPEVAHHYRDFMQALMEAVMKGDSGDDLSQGHSLAGNPAVRAIQERFLSDAANHLEELREVLRNSAEAEDRAAAAWVLGYATDKKLVVHDLEQAMGDPADEVRNDAMRALLAIAELGRRKPELKLRISPDPFVLMLNSLTWTDRNKASAALCVLTEGRDVSLLSELRNQALPSLVEMARWKSPGHAHDAFTLLGRLAGLPEKEIEDIWRGGDRESIIGAALQSGKIKQ